MTRAQCVQLEFEWLLDRALVVFDRAVLRIPDDGLDFRPTEKNMTARQLAHHVYEVLLLLTRGTDTGRIEDTDREYIPFDLDRATSAAEIVEYGDRVKAYVRGVVDRLTDADLDHTINAFGGMTTGWSAMRTALEEALHHRGQMMLYLRLMGLEPPSITGKD